MDFLNQVEAERQKRKLIMIASESFAPESVRASLASRFQNIYAEGYPPEETRTMRCDQILNYPERLTEYRRNSDPRYYKGVEYADTIEELARRRCAALFSNSRVSADQIQVNVQLQNSLGHAVQDFIRQHEPEPLGRHRAQKTLEEIPRKKDQAAGVNQNAEPHRFPEVDVGYKIKIGHP